MADDREPNGRFAPGNSYGQGRPRRAIERDYLTAMTEVVTPDVWRTIVARAVTDAQAGDVEARKWLTKYLLGENPPSLLSLAAADARGVNSEREIDETARAQETETALNAQSQRILERMAGKS